MTPSLQVTSPFLPTNEKLTALCLSSCPLLFSTPWELPDYPLPQCTSTPSCALPGTFAPWPGLIHLATPLWAGELKALFVCTPWEILTPRLHAPTKQRKHLLTAKALTNRAFQMNPAPCGAKGGESPGEKTLNICLFSQIIENLVVPYSDLVEGLRR